MGDTNFFNGLKEYRARFQGSAATTEDFAATMGFVAGQDFTNFFQQWIYGIGAPDFAAGYQSVVINGQNFLKLSLRQTQNAAWPGTGTPGDAFAMPVDIRVDRTGGSTTYAVNSKARTQHFVIPISAPATGIAVDEFNWILTYNKVTEAYVNGPAKVVATGPAPGATIAQSAATTAATITFSEGVNAPSTAFSVAGPTGAVPFTYAFAAANFRSTLTFGSALVAGTYTITVQPTVTTTAAAIALDGEIAAANPTLPSGDGLPGGAAVYSFTVQGIPCSADFNQDGGVDGQDIEAFFVMWEAGNASADVNFDGGVNGDDIDTFFRDWEAGGC